MGVDKSRNIIREARLKIMELPSFERKTEVIGLLLDLEWQIREDDNTTYVYEDEVFDGQHEQPWND